MERFFLFCFKSCLKGDNDKDYYNVLELDPDASADAIRKSYKKLSLTLHPDKLAQRGIEATAEDRQRFIKLKESYDVLSDPRKKRLYDEFGLSGLRLLENPTEQNPMELFKDLITNFQRNRADRFSVALLIALIFSALLILPILFCLKVDGVLGEEAPWLAIWTPMWIVDGIMLLGAFAILCESDPEPSDDEEERKQQEALKIPLATKIHNLISTKLFILAQIFIFLRLDRIVRWSWFAAFGPWFAYEGFTILSTLNAAFFASIPKPNLESRQLMNPVEGCGQSEDAEHDEMEAKMKAEMEYFEKIQKRTSDQKAILISLLRVWLAVFLALQVDGRVDWNWGLVLLPVWVYFFVQYAYSYMYKAWSAKKMAGIDIEALMEGTADPAKLTEVQQAKELEAASSAACFMQCAPLFIAVLLISRLESGTVFTTFVIILPVFIFLGCCCCLVFCGIGCLANIDLDEFNEEMGKEMAGADGAATAGAAGASSETYQPPDLESKGETGSENNTSPILQAAAPPAPVSSSSASPSSSAKAKDQPPPAPPVEARAAEQTHIDADID